MKNLLPTGWGLLLLWLLGSIAQAQDLSRMPGPINAAYTCYPASQTGSSTGTGARITSGSSDNGYAVTPRGELHVLVIYAGFTNDFDTRSTGYNNTDWPQALPSQNQPAGTTFPANANSITYSSPTQFSASATDKSLSNLYYQMSQFSSSPLKLIFHTFPKRINVLADDYTSTPYRLGGLNGFEAYTPRVLQAMKNDPDTQNFDFSQVDRRTNHPGFQVDNSTTSPDGVVDFVVVVWRNPGTPYGLTVPVALGGGGIASIFASVSGIPSLNTSQTYSLDSRDGLTHTGGMSGISTTTFTHEFMHCLVTCPHYLTANSTVGEHFYTGQGHGMMAGIFYTGANAWERWYLGWNGLQANGVAGDVQGAASLPPNGIYTLRNFVPTGDAVRVRLPTLTPTGRAQYLYLENHVTGTNYLTAPNVFDSRTLFIFDGQPTPQPFPGPPSGLLATIVDITDDRTELVSNAFGINGLRTVSAQGNFDYAPQGTPSAYNGHLFGNLLYNFSVTPNPFGGQNQTNTHRMDANGDGIIVYSPGDGNSQTGTSNESVIIDVVNGAFEDGLLGLNCTFNQAGQKMSIASNSPIFEHQHYDSSTQQLSAIPLNGLSVEVLSVNSSTGAVTIRIRYDDVVVDRNTRWTGNLTMTDVVPGSGADVQVSGAALTINKSGTASRQTPTAAGDFITPTRFECAAGTTFAQDAGPLDRGSMVQVTDDNTRFVASGTVRLGGRGNSFVVNNGALLDVTASGNLVLPARSQLIVDAGGTLVIRQGATVSGSGTIEVRPGGYVCLEDGVNWQTSSTFTLAVSPSATIGTKPSLSPSPGASCTNTINNYCGRLTGGNSGLAVGSSNCAGGVVMPPQPRPAGQAAYTVTPNPATDQVVVRFEQAQDGPVRLSVQDMQGQARLAAQAYHLEAGPQALTLAVRELPVGIYLLVVESEDGRHVTRLEVSR